MLLMTALTNIAIDHKDAVPSQHLSTARVMTNMSLDEMTRVFEKEGKDMVASRLFQAAAHLAIAADKLLGGKNVRSR
jgi:hypothetical protein